MFILSLMVSAVLMVVLFALGIFMALVGNYLAGTPRRSYLFSTGLFFSIGFLIALGTIVFLPGSLSYSNGEPYSFKANLWDYSAVIAGVGGVFAALVWQFFVRSRQSRQEVALVCLITLLPFACSDSANSTVSNMTAAREAKAEGKELRDTIKKIEPFFKPMGKPAAYDWLASHNEPGQTFDEYLSAQPTKPTTERQRIYILPLGTFNRNQENLIGVAADYLEAFYDLTVVRMAPRNLTSPAPSSRQNRFTRTRQVKARYILDEVLKPILPNDAAALIALTADDLYSNESTNYVFGQASIENRVGVWSLSRLDDNTDKQTFLRRTLKVAAHETGHMFSMRHCTKYECLMSGTNNLAETDRRPLDACPECTAKICWLSEVVQRERYDRLAAFSRKNGLSRDADEFDRKSAAMRTDVRRP